MQRIIERLDRAYIINLRDRPDRKRQTVREFSKIGIQLPHPKVAFYTAERPSEAGTFPSIGSRGAFTSHRAVLRLAIEQNLSNVLVFEDDIRFRDMAPCDIDRIVSAIGRQPWDILYFGYLSPSDHGLKEPFDHYSGPTIGGHFYAVNGPFIRRMARYMDDCEARERDHPLGGPTYRDGAYNHIRIVDPSIKVLLAVPSMAHQRSSRSDIAPPKSFDRVPWLRPVIDAARAVRRLAR